MKIRFFMLGAFLLLGIICNLLWGSVTIPFSELITALFQEDKSATYYIMWLSRVPQVITALGAGMALALAGLLIQTLFQNVLAGPSVIGVSSGASLGVGLSLLISQYFAFQHPLLLLFSAIIGSILILLFVLKISFYLSHSNALLIVGLMIAYFVSSLTSVIQFFSTKESLQIFSLWGLGSFSSVHWKQMPYFLTVILLTVSFSFLLIKPLNALLLGETSARYLGINVKRMRVIILLFTGVLTGVTTAFCGPIAFLGLAVPHLTRLLFNTSNHKILLPAILLVGGIFAVWSNWIANVPFSEYTLPINAVTSFIGAPVVIFLILGRRVR